MDAFLLDRIYAPLSRVAGRRWGSTACSLSRACIAPMIVFAGIRIAGNPDRGAWEIVFPLVLGALFWFGAGLADRTPNPYSLQPPIYRVIWLVFPVLAAVEFSAELWQIARLLQEVALLSVIYFRAVPAPPAKKRRQRHACSHACLGRLIR